MAAPYRNQPVDLTAPTPQNTPANAAPISSRAQQPGVGSIKEVDEHDARALGALASNPHMVALMQSKLNSLIGKSSGYIESLPTHVRRRITGLKGIQVEHSKLEAQLQEEVLELEKKYFKKFTPLYEKRAKIVNGLEEPTEDEVAVGKAKEEEAAAAKDDEETPAKTEDAPAVSEDKTMSGIPEFWLTAMKSNPSLLDIITDEDEPALRTLTDIRMEYLEKPGFKLIFEFSDNDFFSDKILTKTYFYREESGYGGDFIYDHAEGHTINWKTNKNLTVKVESKKQRNKNTKQTRIIKKTVPTDSFFNFFSPPTPPQDADEADEDIEERLEFDYQLGEDIKEKLIPHAVGWFTGEALQYEGFGDDFEDEEEDFDEDDEEEDSEDGDDDEDDSDEEGDESKPKQDTTECKQS